MNLQRTPLIAGNWKMHMTATEARQFVIRLRPLLADIRDREAALFPPFTALAAVSAELREPNIACGGQNLHWEERGAYTGEVSGPFLADLGCSFVLVGHSERRQLFGETDETCFRKVRAALKAGLVPVLCCGETLEEREADKTLAVIGRQLDTALRDTAPEDGVVVAYEPVWAIGTGRAATPAQAQEVHAWIRDWMKGHLPEGHAERTRVLYGGSVNPDNIDILMAQPDIDGALVGGAGLDVESFARIVQFRPPA